MLSEALIARATTLSSATLHEAAGKRGALPAEIKPLAPHMQVCARAFPVLSPPGDNLWLHRGIYAARPGDVLVIDVGDGLEYGYWGEVMAVAAQARRLAGLILNGSVRDSRQLIEMGFPVFAAGIAIRGTGKNPSARGQLGSPVTLGTVKIHAGDLVFGDADGALVLPASEAETIVARAEAREQEEQTIFTRLRAGESTIEIYHLPKVAI
jgi:4-hydroxy-4-methyl-2-oxoglutarate aldolase